MVAAIMTLRMKEEKDAADQPPSWLGTLLNLPKPKG